MRLVVGAGNRRKDGFVHHDVQPLEGIDVVCEFTELPAHIDPESCEEIHMTHVLEHFPMKDTINVLGTLYSLLAPKGKLYIEVPNFYWHAEEILKDPFNRQIIEYAFGGQLNEWDFHYNGFTPEILNEDLVEAGFTVLSLVPNSTIESWVQK